MVKIILTIFVIGVTGWIYEETISNIYESSRGYKIVTLLAIMGFILWVIWKYVPLIIVIK